MSAPLRDPESIGRHFWIGLQPSPDPTDHDRRLLEELSPAGVVLFRENFAHGEAYEDWLARLARLLEEVRARIGRERILVGIDHEGGRVQRTPPPITALPAARTWGDRSAEIGRLVGRELASLGVNVDFAPVVDVDSNPDNPIIGDRAFSRHPAAVVERARGFLRGLRKEGVLGCLKHFPGHGDTVTDSHLGLPVVAADRATLERRELLPYRELAHEAPLVMTAHVLVPAIDPELPATLSPPFLRGILRGEIGFPGVVLSDDLGMRAVSERFRDPATAVEAVAAGCDQLLLCAHLADTRRALDMARAVEGALEEGRLDAEDLSAAAERVERLLAAASRPVVEPLPSETLAAHASLLA